MTSGQIKHPVIFFGTEEFSARSLRALIEAGYPIAAVITKPDTKKGRGKQLSAPTIKRIAQEHAIPVWQPRKLSDVTSDIKTLQPVCGVLVSFGKIIPQAVIDLFSPGIINVHPSLLPHYRGPSPIEAAILNGDSLTGVSIMQLSAKMDAGPLYTSTTLPLQGTETALELYDTLGTLGADSLVRLLPTIIDGSLTPIPQDDTQATYCSLIHKQDGIIDWSKPAAQIEREVRAYQGWPGSRTTLGKVDVIITSSHVSAENEPLSVRCADGKYLVIDTLKPVGKKEMPAKAFLAGYKLSTT